MIVESLVVGETRKERFVADKVIILGRIIYWLILHEVALRVAKRLCKSSRTW